MTQARLNDLAVAVYGTIAPRGSGCGLDGDKKAVQKYEFC
ncbi:hypothetical protein ABIA30_001373 [Mycobacterium sp. MAA66]